MGMIQLIVNTTLLRELDERKLINAYARYCYNSQDDIEVDTIILNNLKTLLDWDINGDNGLKIYCGKFESLKAKDWTRLLDVIKENSDEIRKLSYAPRKKRRLKSIKIVNDYLRRREEHEIERFTDENYEVSGRGKKAKPCTYEGRTYKSRQECMYKEGIKRSTLYTYLKNTNQL